MDNKGFIMLIKNSNAGLLMLGLISFTSICGMDVSPSLTQKEASGIAEIRRMDTVIEELTAKNKALEAAVIDRDAQIALLLPENSYGEIQQLRTRLAALQAKHAHKTNEQARRINAQERDLALLNTLDSARASLFEEQRAKIASQNAEILQLRKCLAEAGL